MIGRQLKKERYQHVYADLMQNAHNPPLCPICEVGLVLNGESYALFLLPERHGWVYALYAPVAYTHLYVGDSILGFRAHMGAGAVTSNVKSDQTPVTVSCGDEKIETGLHKCGALVGDGAEIGCGAVLNPGTVIGRGARVYPLSMVRGIVPAESIYKRQGEIAAIRR